MAIHHRMHTWALTIGLILCGFAAAPTQAGLVTTTLQGSVDTADASNPFGLASGSTVTAVAVYDDVLIPAAGGFNLAFDSDPTFSLKITFGNFTFTASDDDAFGSGFPRFQFANGILSGLDFELDGFSAGGFTDLTLGEFDNQTRWFLDDNIGSVTSLLEGTWDFSNAVTLPVTVVVAVTEPGTWILFAAGLLGLLLFGGRNSLPSAFGNTNRRLIP